MHYSSIVKILVVNLETTCFSFQAAVDFCMKLNTKANRKKLVRALFTVQRTRYGPPPLWIQLKDSMQQGHNFIFLKIYFHGDFTLAYTVIMLRS